jgi:1-acyl-sn-glycerol-3-phosphate acyltransferase
MTFDSGAVRHRASRFFRPPGGAAGRLTHGILSPAFRTRDISLSPGRHLQPLILAASCRFVTRVAPAVPYSFRWLGPRLFCKDARHILVGVSFLLLTVLLIPLQALAVARRWALRRSLPTTYHRLVCRMIGVRIRVVGEPATQRPLLITANHSSWIDIPVLTSIMPVVFIAKREVGTWPLIGLLAKLQRSVFVDRERRHKTTEANSEIAQRLTGGDAVVLFAEGTSSDGNRVLPFRSALLGAARETLARASSGAFGEIMVQPLSIAYVGKHGLRIGRPQRHQVAWYGGIDLMPHLKEVLRSGAIDVVLTWGEPVPYDGRGCRKELAKTLETRVRRMTVGALRAA